MKQKLVAAVGLVLALGLFAGSLTSIAGAEEASPLSEGCEANKICIYASPNYNNLAGKIDCSYGGLVPPLASESATNRCGNKTDWLRANGTTIACMNPGGNRPNPGLFNEVYVAKEYGAFC